MYQMLPVSLDRPFFNVPSVFSNVYFLIVDYGTINVQHYHFSHIKTRKNLIKHYTIKLPGRLFSCIKKKWPPRCNWNIVESGVNHHNPNPRPFTLYTITHKLFTPLSLEYWIEKLHRCHANNVRSLELATVPSSLLLNFYDPGGSMN